MAFTDIEKIFRKRKPRGEDVAKIEIIEDLYNTLKVSNFDQAQKSKSLITPEKKEKMWARYEQNATEKDFEDYGFFIAMYEWVKYYRRWIEFYNLQSINTYNLLSKSLDMLDTSEAIQRYISNLPTIVTERQYNEAGGQIASKHGVAILQEGSTGVESRIDANTGHYQPPTDCNDKIGKVEAIKKADSELPPGSGNNVIIYSNYPVNGYNTAIELFSQIYDFEDLLEARQEIGVTKAHAKYMNWKIDTLCQSIENADYMDTEEKREKIDAISNVYPHLDYNDTELPQMVRDDAADCLKDRTAFTDDRLARIVFYHWRTSTLYQGKR